MGFLRFRRGGEREIHPLTSAPPDFLSLPSRYCPLFGMKGHVDDFSEDMIIVSTVIQFLPLSVIEKLPPLLVSCLLRSGLADQTGFDLFLKPIGVSSNIDSSGVMEDAVEDG